MIERSYIIGVQGFFVPNGTAFTIPAAGIASRTAKPGATDTSWLDMGVFKDNDFGFEKKQEARDVFAAAPGNIVLYDEILTKGEVDFKMGACQLSPFYFSLMFGAQALSQSGTNQVYNPLAAPTVHGWLKTEWYDDQNNLLNVLDHWVSLKTDGEIKFGDNVVTVNLMARGLYSSLNVGTLS